MSDWEGEYEVPAGEASYTGNPATRPIDAVRLELGKDKSLTLITDLEISYNLGRAGSNVLLAASYSAETIAGHYADMVDKSMGGSSVSLSQKAEAWRKKAAALKSMAMNTSITPIATSSAPRTLKFGIGQHDNVSGYGGVGFL
jgi:hypothetical protein